MLAEIELKGKIMRTNHKIGKPVSTMDLILLKEWGWFESSLLYQNDASSQYRPEARMLDGLHHLSNRRTPDAAEGLRRWLSSCYIDGF